MKINVNIADLEKGGIYRIINTTNSKVYIGSTKNFNRRAIEHQKMLEDKKHHSYHLQNAYDKYGSDAFNFEILEILEDISKKNLISREAY